MRLIGPIACGLVWLIGLIAGWEFAVMLVASMWVLLGGNLLALALRKKDE
jgi:hypothetical protein